MSPLLGLLLLQTPGEVAFDYTSPKGLVVAGMAANGDKAVQVLVDTGARRTLIDAKLAREMKLEAGEEIRAYGAGGAVDTRVAKGLRLKGLTEGIDVVALPLETIGKAVGTPIDVILGQDVLASRVLEIDGRTMRLTFGVRPAAVFGGDTVIPLTTRAGRPYVAATVVNPEGGLLSADLLLDTGSDTTVELVQRYADETGLKTRADPLGRRITGVGGTVTVRVAELREIRIGGRVVPSQEVRVYLPPASAASDGDGRVGGGFLSRFKVTIDGPGAKLVLRELRPASAQGPKIGPATFPSP